MTTTAEEIPFLMAALEADPGNWSTRRYLADYYLSNGDEKRAIALVTTSPVAPDHEDHAVFAAQVTSRLSRKRAHQLLDTFLVDNAASAKAHYLKARLFELDGKPENAMTHRRVALVLNPTLEQLSEEEQIDVAPVDNYSMQELAHSYEAFLPEVAAAAAPEVASVDDIPVRSLSPRGTAPVEPVTSSTPVAVVTDGEDEVPDAAIDVAPPGATEEEIALAAAPSVSLASDFDEELVAPVETSQIKPLAAPGTVAVAVAAEAEDALTPAGVLSQETALIAVSAVSAAEATHNPDVILSQLAEEEAAEVEAPAEDIQGSASNIVEKQTAMVAAMSDTSGEVLKNPR